MQRACSRDSESAKVFGKMILLYIYLMLKSSKNYVQLLAQIFKKYCSIMSA